LEPLRITCQGLAAESPESVVSVVECSGVPSTYRAVELPLFVTTMWCHSPSRTRLMGLPVLMVGPPTR
jgi:hypothetical protein